MATQPKNLAELRRATREVGTIVTFSKHRYPALAGRRKVTKASTVDLITDCTRADGTYVEHCHLDWRAASDWKFTTAGAECWPGGEWLCTIRVGETKMAEFRPWRKNAAGETIECQVCGEPAVPYSAMDSEVVGEFFNAEYPETIMAHPDCQPAGWTMA